MFRFFFFEGQQKCDGNRNYTVHYQTCGQYDTDPCLEWSDIISCQGFISENDPIRQTCNKGEDIYMYCLNEKCVKKCTEKGAGGEEGCTTSDGVGNYYMKGTVTSGNAEGTDYCRDDKILEEFYCWDGVESGTYTCPYGCKDGACIDPLK